MGAINTPKATLSYPHFDKAQEAQNEGEKAKFSGVFVFAPGSDLKAMKAAALEVAIEKWGAVKGPGMVTTGGKGSTFRNDVEGKYPEGSVYISARSETKPGLVYRHAEPGSQTEKRPNGVPAKVPDDKVRDVFYAGSQVLGQVKPFAYDKKGNKGIGWALNNVQWLSDGERLDNRVKAEDAFEAELNEEPANLAALGLA